MRFGRCLGIVHRTNAHEETRFSSVWTWLRRSPERLSPKCRMSALRAGGLGLLRLEDRRENRFREVTLFEMLGLGRAGGPAGGRRRILYGESRPLARRRQ